MIPLAEVNTPQYALGCINALLDFANPNAVQALTRRFFLNGWGEAEISFFPSTNNLPAAAGATLEGTQVWVGVSGTDSFEQVKRYAWPTAVGVFDPVEFGPDRVEVGQHNRYFAVWGKEVYARIMAVLTPRVSTVFLTGHSYGGAVVTDAAILLAQLKRPLTIILTTFGAPKVGGKQWMRGIDRVVSYRYFNANDPVPALPPNEGEVGVGIRLPTKLALSAIIGGYDYAPGGRIITLLGEVKLRQQAAITPSVFDLFEPTEEVSTQIGLPSAHLLSEYRTRVERVIRRRAFSTLLATPNTVPAPRRAAQDKASSTPEELNMAYVAFPRGMHPKPVRISANKYMVYWMERAIFGPVPVGNAKAFCRKLNFFLKRVGTTGPIFKDEFALAWDSFINAAGTDNPDFNPSPWNVA